MANLRTNTGRHLNELWAVGAKHALYHRDGLWYERLEQFPGALFDANGYVLFETEEAFTECQDLRIKQKVWVPKGIVTIPNYRQMRPSHSAADPAGLQVLGIVDAFEEGGVKFQLHRWKERNRKAVRRKKEVILAKCGRLACEVCDFDFARVYGALGTDFAECHHRTPLASLEENHRTRLNELAIVCSNCHRMLHRSHPMLAVEELRKIVLQYQQSGRD